MSIFVIGDQDTILGLALVSVEGKAVQTKEEANSALDEVLSQIEPAILLITAPVAHQIQTRVNALKMSTLHPVVVEIPGSRPEAPAASLREQIEEVVGMSLKA